MALPPEMQAPASYRAWMDMCRREGIKTAIERSDPTKHVGRFWRGDDGSLYRGRTDDMRQMCRDLWQATGMV